MKKTQELTPEIQQALTNHYLNIHGNVLVYLDENKIYRTLELTLDIIIKRFPKPIAIETKDIDYAKSHAFFHFPPFQLDNICIPSTTLEIESRYVTLLHLMAMADITPFHIRLTHQSKLPYNKYIKNIAIFHESMLFIMDGDTFEYAWTNYNYMLEQLEQNKYINAFTNEYLPYKERIEMRIPKEEPKQSVDSTTKCKTTVDETIECETTVDETTECETTVDKTTECKIVSTKTKLIARKPRKKPFRLSKEMKNILQFKNIEFNTHPDNNMYTYDYITVTCNLKTNDDNIIKNKKNAIITCAKNYIMHYNIIRNLYTIEHENIVLSKMKIQNHQLIMSFTIDILAGLNLETNSIGIDDYRNL